MNVIIVTEKYFSFLLKFLILTYFYIFGIFLRFQIFELKLTSKNSFSGAQFLTVWILDKNHTVLKTAVFCGYIDFYFQTLRVIVVNSKQQHHCSDFSLKSLIYLSSIQTKYVQEFLLRKKSKIWSMCFYQNKIQINGKWNSN